VLLYHRISIIVTKSISTWKTGIFNGLVESKVTYYQAFKALKLAKE